MSDSNLKPNITCIIPVKDRVEEVRDAINSVIKQQMPTQLIVVENGGLNNVESLLLRMVIPDHIKVDYVSMKRSSANAARAKGQSYAKGKYIQFLDSDDVLDENKWINQIKHFKDEPGLDVSLSRTYKLDVNDKKKILLDPVDYASTINLTSFISGRHHPITGAGLWRREVADMLVWPGDLGSSQDWESHFRALLKGVKMMYCDSASYTIRTGLSKRISDIKAGDKAYNKLIAILINLSEIELKALNKNERWGLLFLMIRLIRVCSKSQINFKGCKRSIVLQVKRLIWP